MRMTPEQVHQYQARRAATKAFRIPPSAASVAEDLAEKDLQESFSQYLRMRQIPFFRQMMHKRSTAIVGTPDFIVCLPPEGRFVAIECKVGRNDLTDEQKRVRDQIISAGAPYYVVRTLAEAIEAIKTKDQQCKSTP